MPRVRHAAPPAPSPRATPCRHPPPPLRPGGTGSDDRTASSRATTGSPEPCRRRSAPGARPPARPGPPDCPARATARPRGRLEPVRRAPRGRGTARTAAPPSRSAETPPGRCPRPAAGRPVPAPRPPAGASANPVRRAGRHAWRRPRTTGTARCARRPTAGTRRTPTRTGRSPVPARPAGSRRSPEPGEIRESVLRTWLFSALPAPRSGGPHRPLGQSASSSLLNARPVHCPSWWWCRITPPETLSGSEWVATGVRCRV